MYCNDYEVGSYSAWVTSWFWQQHLIKGTKCPHSTPIIQSLRQKTKWIRPSKKKPHRWELQSRGRAINHRDISFVLSTLLSSRQYNVPSHTLFDVSIRAAWTRPQEETKLRVSDPYRGVHARPVGERGSSLKTTKRSLRQSFGDSSEFCVRTPPNWKENQTFPWLLRAWSLSSLYVVLSFSASTPQPNENLIRTSAGYGAHACSHGTWIWGGKTT